MLRSLAVCVSRATVAVTNQSRQSRPLATQAAAAMQQTLKPVAEVEKDHVSLQLPEGAHHKFPTMWLRDNCQCPSCFNKQQHSRILYWEDFDVSVQAVDVQTDEANMAVKWSDGHTSSYTLDWLKERSFNPEDQKQFLDKVYRLPKVAWNAEKYKSILHRFNYEDILKSDEHLLGWLQAMAKYGVAIVYGTPSREDANLALGDRVMFPRKTHYGVLFHVRDKPDTTNVAYLKEKLEMHTDLMYYEYKPGINMLHCLVQTEGSGGDNLLADAYYISEKLRETQPDVYKTLSTVPVTWADIGEDGGRSFYSLYRAPVICENMFGEFMRINYSQPQRSSHFNASLEQVKSWYKAYHVFTQELHSPENKVHLKTEPGEILTFDNIRLVHAREGYNDRTGNERHIIGMFLDWDEVFSRIRVLRRDLGIMYS